MSDDDEDIELGEPDELIVYNQSMSVIAELKSRVRELDAELKAEKLSKSAMEKRWNLNYMPHEFNEVREYIEQMKDFPAPWNNALAFAATLYSENNRTQSRVRELESEVHRARTDSRYWDEFNTISRHDAIRNENDKLKAERDRLKAIENAGHSEDCGGMDTVEGRCGCGWLQREGAHKYILSLEADWNKTKDENIKLRARHAALKLENEVLESMSRHSPSPCGHSSQYAYTEDGGKHIICLLCSHTRHTALVKLVTKIAQPISCGCNPCTGDCVSQNALQIYLDEIKAECKAALAEVKK